MNIKDAPKFIPRTRKITDDGIGHTISLSYIIPSNFPTYTDELPILFIDSDGLPVFKSHYYTAEYARTSSDGDFELSKVVPPEENDQNRLKMHLEQDNA